MRAVAALEMARAGRDAETCLCDVQPTKVDINGAETYQPFVEQAGSQPNFPSATSGPFALTGNVVRYVAIGGKSLRAFDPLPVLSIRKEL